MSGLSMKIFSSWTMPVESQPPPSRLLAKSTMHRSRFSSYVPLTSLGSAGETAVPSHIDANPAGSLQRKSAARTSGVFSPDGAAW